MIRACWSRFQSAFKGGRLWKLASVCGAACVFNATYISDIGWASPGNSWRSCRFRHLELHASLDELCHQVFLSWNHLGRGIPQRSQSCLYGANRCTREILRKWKWEGVLQWPQKLFCKQEPWKTLILKTDSTLFKFV